MGTATWVEDSDTGEKSHREYSWASFTWYYQQWRFGISDGYSKDNYDEKFTDTNTKVKRRFKPAKKLTAYLGVGAKLPTDHYPGNHTDYKFYSSFYWYPDYELSVFWGYTYTIVRDTSTFATVRNTYSYYAGAGYYVLPKLRLGFSYSQSKYTYKEPEEYFGVGADYKLTNSLSLSLSYSQELVEDRDDEFDISLSYYFH